MTGVVVVRSEAPAPALAAPAQPVPTQPASTPPGFAAQFARPLASLATAAPGEHVLTVSVTPENLGPVTVQAHIDADGVRVGLFAPSDAGRAAVQAVLPDLRRDLADSGLGATLDLSSRNAPQQHPGARGGLDNGGTPTGGRSDAGSGDGGRGGRGSRRGQALRVDGAPSARAAPLRPGTDTSLDILA